MISQHDMNERSRHSAGGSERIEALLASSQIRTSTKGRS
jgi:hypothetical protein